MIVFDWYIKNANNCKQLIIKLIQVILILRGWIQSRILFLALYAEIIQFKG